MEKTTPSSPWGQPASLESASQPELTPREYVIWLGLCFLYGIVWVAASTLLLAEYPHPFYLSAVGAGLLVMGEWVADRSLDWRISLIGNTLASVGVGALLAPWSTFFPHGPLAVGLLLFFGFLFLLLLGLVSPALVRAWGAGLIAGAISLLLGWELTPSLLGFELEPLHIGVAILFLCLLDHFWSRAFRLPFSRNNAVDASCALYLETLHLLLLGIEKLTRRKTLIRRRRSHRF